ncbi:PREDICTED: apolipoprotein L3-like [Elephantulus edwardii]|uniref:apolipoprotein L3-like n=1 Tax=Elephantulus edwardii TaxID=28737 RepID=UPI0003F09A22|nr:PREDICTED: apolipoprotein L3-like [Elephantulus edwardii]
MEDEDVCQKEQQVVDKFLSEFPEIKEKLENCIRDLEALEENSEATHRGCTIANVVSDSVGIVSGLLTIASLLLAPVTAGASLGLLAAGTGLGTAAAATSITSSIVDNSVDLSALDRAEETLSNASLNVLNDVEEVITEAAGALYECIQDGMKSWENFRAIRLVQDNTGLASNDELSIANARLLRPPIFVVGSTLRGTVLSMTKAARIGGMASAGFFLMFDVASLVSESRHLYEGAKPESAEKVRLVIENLKKMVRVLTDIYENLQSGTQ